MTDKEIAEIRERAMKRGLDHELGTVVNQDIPNLLDEVERLREGLSKYGSHVYDCDYVQKYTDCTCGLHALLKGAEE